MESMGKGPEASTTRARALHKAPAPMIKPSLSSVSGPALLASAAWLLLSAPALAASSASPTGADSGPSAPAIELQMRVPLFAGEFSTTPVARVDGDVVTAAELAAALEGAHGRHGTGAKAGAKDILPMLQRLVDVKLIVAEARDSELDKQPEVKRKIEKLEETQLKDILRTRLVEGVKLDKAQLQRASQAATTEYRMHSLNFESEEDAKQVAARMAAGASFADVAKALAAEKKARDLGEGSLSGIALGPAFGPVLRRTKAGAVTPPTKEAGTWIVARLLEVKQRDDPNARAAAEATALATAREEALHRYSRELSRRYAKVDRKLLQSLDWDAPQPGAAALAKDRRAIARLSGGAKITVADLTEELERQFWHGLEDAAGKKRIAPRVQPSFDSLLFRALLLQEAAQQKLRDTEEFRKPVRAATERVLFDAFLKSAIAPSIQVTEEEVHQHYEAHRQEYATPAMVRLDGLAFASSKDAQTALARLKAGTDFKWLKSNADGVVPAEEQKLHFDGNPVTASSLPEGLAKAISGAKEGDYRLHAGDGESYVVHVVKDFPSGYLPFDDAAKGIREKLFGEKVGQAIKGWADRVRPHHDVQVYVAQSGP
jgi:hypothetical protein